MKPDYKNKVCCHVTECSYHGNEDTCQANGITVNGEYDAKSPESTMCQTFVSGTH